MYQENPVRSHGSIDHAGSKVMPKLKGKKGTYEANEGIWIQSIRKALHSKTLILVMLFITIFLL